MRIMIGMVFSLWLISCGKTKDNKTVEADGLKILAADSIKRNEFDYEGHFKLENYLVSDQTDTSKVQIIDFDCALIIGPTSDQINEMTKNEKGEDLSTIADDNYF